MFTSKPMTLESIPACKDCKHYLHLDNFFLPCCKFHYFEKPDYINGYMEKIEMIAPEVRKNEDLCGHEGKNFEPIEVIEEEPFSYRKCLKEFFTGGWMF